jgi:hypothetical protein
MCKRIVIPDTGVPTSLIYFHLRKISGGGSNTGVIPLLSKFLGENQRTWKGIWTWQNAQLWIQLEVFSDSALINVNMPVLILNNIYLPLGNLDNWDV